MKTNKQLNASVRRTEEALCKSILGYLKRRPHAEDTPEGIAQWWLLEQQIRIETTRVKAALLRLVQRRCLAVRRRLDGRVFYRLHPERHQQRGKVE